MKYKFPQFKAEIIDPQIAVQSVNDNLKEKTCSVDILLTTESAQFGVNLNGFTYSDTWDDADVYTWVTVELEKFAV
jgi:hypothetical protein